MTGQQQRLLRHRAVDRRRVYADPAGRGAPGRAADVPGDGLHPSPGADPRHRGDHHLFGRYAAIFVAPIAVSIFVAVKKLYIRDSLVDRFSQSEGSEYHVSV
jgi:hypothetical protein